MNNPFVNGAMTQIFCVVTMVAVSLMTRPKPIEEVRPLTFSFDKIRLPAGEPKRPAWQRVSFWWTLFVLFYAGLYVWLR